MWRNACAKPTWGNSFIFVPLASPPHFQAGPTSKTRLWEGGIVAALFLLIVAFKLCYTRTLSVNSDEPQHLHVVLGWTQGMVQYRDYFDNHTPLFHLMFAPLAAWLGERADMLFRMRLAMLPLWAFSLGCTYWLGAHLY